MLSPKNRVMRLWSFLVEPHPSVIERDQRRQVRLLASSIIVLIMTYTLVELLPVALRCIPLTMGFIIASIGMGLLVGAYGLSRYGYIRQAILIFSNTLSFMIFSVVFVSGVESAQYMLYYLVLPILVMSVFLPRRYLLWTLAVNIAGMFILEHYADFITQESLPVIFVTVFTLLVILITRHRELLESDRQAQLIAEEERYRMLFNALSDGVVVHKGGIIQDVNTVFLSMYGYQRDDVIGHDVMEFVDRDSHEITRHNTQHQSIEPYEINMIKYDGTVLQVEITGAYYTYRGERLRVAVVRDITERKYLERQNLELQLERQRNELMQRFIGDASHDLKTPITVISTTLHLLKRNPDDPKRDQRIRMLEQQTERLTMLIQDMLTISRLQKAAADRFDFQKQDLNRVARRAIDEQKVLAEAKNLELVFEGTPLPPLLVDEAEFVRAVRQLIVNALNYTETGGVYVRTYLDMEERHAVLEVRDTGIGMSGEDREHIFELFYRADRARGTSHGGMGLGLAFAQRIVQAHGGSIRVESEPNRGSTFYVVLPVVFDGSVENLLPYPLA